MIDWHYWVILGTIALVAYVVERQAQILGERIQDTNNLLEEIRDRLPEPPEPD